ncbi:MAG: hypothetical protein LBV41_10955, partial [Cytophagaceae bacterium]|nr:hypothetical protein [Cytophagaceae bacterium]
MDDLYNIFTELYGRRNSLSHSDKEFIKKTYLDRYNGRMSKTCNQAYADAITHILIRLRVENKTFTTMEKSNYLLKNGVIINSA